MNKFVLISLILLTIFSNSCRTPSIDRLERDCSLKLPEKYVVTEDLFESEGPDFALTYEVIIDQNNIHEVTRQLETNDKWVQSNNLWTFKDTNDGIRVYATFDSKTGTLSYSQVLI